MDINYYLDEMKLSVTGGLLELELTDDTLIQILNTCLREVQRYIDTIKVITIPYQRCINMSEYNPNSIVGVYRTDGFYNSESKNDLLDPMQVGMWQIMGGAGIMYGLNNAIYSLASWNTMLQMRNTMSTDLAYFWEPEAQQLYINTSNATPSNITIAYIPRFTTVEEITSDFWIDKLTKLAIAKTKIAVGRIRSRYTQTNALWTNDGPTLLEEGNSELSALRERLMSNTQLIYGID